MSTWRLFVLGHEVLRTERSADADKTLGQAIGELIDTAPLGDDDDDEVSYEEAESLRVAGEDEHLIFTSNDTDDG